MSVSIITCPRCSTLLLGDTAQCPTCRHILDQGRLEELGEVAVPPAESPQVAESASATEVACSQCGESVRKGLVRCWNCGSFMRQEIADLYERMQSSPRPVIYSNDAGAERASKSPSQAPNYSHREDNHTHRDHFHREEMIPLAGDGEELEADDFDFELSPEFSIVQDEGNLQGGAASDSEATYALSPTISTPSTPVSIAPLATSASAAIPPSPSSVDSRPSGTVGQNNQPGAARTGRSTDVDDVSHSVATAGDALLKAALEEEEESARRKGRRRGRVSTGSGADGFRVYCPKGHRIIVQERHRGKMGRCPSCKSPFIVPMMEPSATTAAGEKASQEGTPAAAGGAASSLAAVGSGSASKNLLVPVVTSKIEARAWHHLIRDASSHSVVMTKFKPKRDALKKPTYVVDLAFSDEGVQIVRLLKGATTLGTSDVKKRETAREKVLEELRGGKPLSEVTLFSQVLIPASRLTDLLIVQPPGAPHEAPFGDVPVFGEGRIGVKIPPAEPDSKELTFLSFTLNEFRTFSESLEQSFGISDFGAIAGVPLEDEVEQLTCHYSEEKLTAIKNLPYYRADSKYRLNLIGRRCAGCGLVVSEASRKKEKLGGLNGKSIAKTKCPKCANPFGDISLFEVQSSSTDKK